MCFLEEVAASSESGSGAARFFPLASRLGSLIERVVAGAGIEVVVVAAGALRRGLAARHQHGDNVNNNDELTA